MGKNLIVVGADFSANGFFEDVALEPTWTESTAWVAKNGASNFGQKPSSLNFDSSDKVVLPRGAKKLTYTSCIYTTSSQAASGFGLLFWDANDSPIIGYDFPAGTTGVEVKTVVIPSNAVKVCFTYFKDTLTDIPFNAIAKGDD